LLGFFEFVAQLEKMELIRFEDIEEIFGYYILRIGQNQTITEYRQFLKSRVNAGKYPENISFPNFEALALKMAGSNNKVPRQ
jgi:hypothetical protein